jgi:hypothetical protein
MVTTGKVADAAQQITEKKTVFEKVLVATPVILTVVATFLVSQSSGEMTRAQYHRASASQNQSKVGDQWAFFQAKRMRGTSYELTAEVLGALKDAQPFQRDTLSQAADGLARQLAAAGKSCAALRASLDKSKDSPAAGPLAEKISRLADVIGKIEAKAKKASSDMNTVLSSDSLTALIGPQQEARPDKQQGEEQSAATAQLKQILADIQKRRPEKEIAPLVLSLPEETLDEAIAAADRKADTVAKKGKVTEYALEKVDKLVDRQLALAQEFLGPYAGLAPELSSFDETVPTDAMARQIRSLERHAQTIRQMSDKLRLSYKAARHSFTARRYEDDARSNQDAAYLYEVKAYLSSARSDRHLIRSRNFMYAMLVAQAGVTIATLALAVRQKSLMWGVATAAGLIAISIGVYVYLGMG